MWIPWGPCEVSCVERCPHFRGKVILRSIFTNVLNTEVSLFHGVLQDGFHYSLQTTRLTFCSYNSVFLMKTNSLYSPALINT